jgi:3-dehydroquinate synthase
VVLARDYAGLAGELARLELGGRAFLLTDRHVGPLFSGAVVRALRRAGLHVSGQMIPAGERQKSMRRLAWLLDRLADARLERNDTLVALGGGVIGDLGGFAAASYLRGIQLVHLPTTLLAVVDSSIGGKTAVNLARGKNLAGAFHQPRLVYAALHTLASLPRRQLRSGLAEVIKAGMIADPSLVAHLEGHLEEILALAPQALLPAVAAAVRVKARIVGMDEREAGQRALLNYGHTVGHAIESATGYRRFLHGEAVAVGMVAAAWLATALGVCSPATAERQNRLLARAGLPLRAGGLASRAILAKMRHDKKISQGRQRFVLTSRVGSASVQGPLSHALVERAISYITKG